MSIIANDLRVGNIIGYKDAMWRVVSTEHVKPGKGGAFMQVELKNIVTGTKLNERFRSDETIDKLVFEAVKMTFLYKDGENLEFMDMITLNQFSVSVDIVGNRLAFLTDNMEVTVEIVNGDQIVGIILPDTVILEVSDTQPYIKGQTVTATFKPATLSNGIVIQVPQFIEIGERVVVKTHDTSYVERAKKG